MKSYTQKNQESHRGATIEAFILCLHAVHPAGYGWKSKGMTAGKHTQKHLAQAQVRFNRRFGDLC